ncbi:MAG TPA: hypothetical protein DCP36_15705 [Sporomusaceae bacterium]|nr:hypothetical protein [Sporomusaceae bacterium]
MTQEIWSLLFYTIICIVGSLSCYITYRDYLHPGILLTWIYYYYTAGSTILYILGFSIHPGIRTYYIADATMVSSFAIISFILPSLIIRRAKESRNTIFIPEYIKPQAYRIFGLLSLAITLIILICFSFVANTYFNSGLAKNQIIALMPGWFLTIHYIYMVFWMSFFAIILSVCGIKFLKRHLLLSLNFFIFIGYCLVTRERDFVLFFIPILLIMNRKKKMSIFKIFIFMLIVLFFITGLYTLKSDEISYNLTELLLNQGSTLLILTNIMSWIDDGMELEYGATYLNSIINLIPSFIYREGVPLIHWFKENYNSTSTVGYGFSLEAEGYLNFGILGVILTFLLIGILFQTCYLKFQKNTLTWNYIYLFLTPYYIYAIRGDSLMLFKGLVYGVFLFFFILFCSQGLKLYIKRCS